MSDISSKQYPIKNKTTDGSNGPNRPMRYMGATICLILATIFLSFPIKNAHAIEFRYRVSNRVESTDKARLYVTPAARVATLRIDLKRNDGKKVSFNAQGLTQGAEHEFSWEQPTGKFTYSAALTATQHDGRQTVLNFQFDVESMAPLKVEIDKEKTQVGEGRLVLSANRPIAKVEGSIYSEDGNQVINRTMEIPKAKASAPVEFRWDPSQSESIGRIEIKVFDISGFWMSMAMNPFWVEIPHETVIFDSGKWNIKPEEEPKLHNTLKRIHEEMKKHGKDLDLRLYVAGYTDTVGSASDNMTLSRNRAREIGRWFLKEGLKIPTYYQGFGQSVLAVETADNTPEEHNRRALYILGSTIPLTNSQIPSAHWNRVR